MRSLLIMSALGLLAPGSGGLPAVEPTAQSAQMWQIGPVVGGRNLSAGMPPSPTQAGQGWYFDFPNPGPGAGHVNYLTKPTRPLLGKSRVVIRYRIDAAEGVRIVPRASPDRTATLSLYFQRRGDNWSGRGPFEYYRWYSTGPNRIPLKAGEHEVSLSLDGPNWKSVISARGDQAPAEFRASLQNAERVGFVLGGAGGAGHGVYSTGPARFTLISFQVF